MAREFTPSPTETPEPSLTTYTLPVWLPNPPQPTTSYHHAAEAAYLKFLQAQEQGYPIALQSDHPVVTPTMPGPALIEATPPFFFENALRYTRSQASILAKRNAYVTENAMMAKLAAATVGFLHSLGYVRISRPNVSKRRSNKEQPPDVVLRAVTIGEYSNEQPRRNKKVLQQAKMEIEAEAHALRKAHQKLGS